MQHMWLARTHLVLVRLLAADDRALERFDFLSNKPSHASEPIQQLVFANALRDISGVEGIRWKAFVSEALFTQ